MPSDTSIPQPRGRSLGSAGAGLLALALAGGCATSGPAPPSPASPPERAVETFEPAWQIIHDTHFDPEFNGVDWAGAREELRPRAAEATSLPALRQVIREMLDRLGQSHFELLPREAVEALAAEGSGDSAEAGAGSIGIDLRRLDGQMVVTRVLPQSPAAAAGVRPGWVVRRLNDRGVEELARLLPEGIDERLEGLYHRQMVMARLDGDPGTTVSVEFLDGRDRPAPMALTRQSQPGETVKLGNLPPLRSHLEHERLSPEGTTVTVGMIRFNIWMLPLARPFDEAIDALRGSDGIVIDLRGNPGGVGGMAMGIAGHFLDEQVALGTMITRDNELNFMANPRRVNPAGQPVAPFNGPVAILVDGLTGSTSEIFAGGLQALKRARVFGQTTMGAALPALMDRLPNGDILLHAFADYVTATDVQLEGRGGIPDEPVPATRADLLAGRDGPLRRAIDWIAAQPRAQGAPDA